MVGKDNINDKMAQLREPVPGDFLGFKDFERLYSELARRVDELEFIVTQLKKRLRVESTLSNNQGFWEEVDRARKDNPSPYIIRPYILMCLKSGIWAFMASFDSYVEAENAGSDILRYKTVEKYVIIRLALGGIFGINCSLIAMDSYGL